MLPLLCVSDPSLFILLHSVHVSTLTCSVAEKNLCRMFDREPVLEQDLSDVVMKVSNSPICEQLRHAKMAMQSRHSPAYMPIGAVDSGLQYLSHLHASPRSIRERRRSMRKKFSSPAA